MNRQMIKSIGKMLLFITPIAMIGGYATGIYTLEHSTQSLVDAILQEIETPFNFYIITTLQSTIYAIIATVIGYLLAKRTGLLKPFSFKKETLKKTIPVIIIAGVLFASDYFIFGSLIPEVAADYKKGISPAYFLSSLTYGAVIEELLLRWFFMSLLAWIFILLFARKRDSADIPGWIYILANILSATTFALGHLPATLMFFNTLSPLILFRCFLLNGGLALLFGRYYRKYGIQYAMLAHFGLHFISKLILIFIL